MADDILVAKATTQIHYEGKRLIITAGKTTARQGHPILEQYGDLFEPLRPDFDVRSDEPKVDTKAVRAWAADKGIEVPARGKLPTDVIEQYRAATEA